MRKLLLLANSNGKIRLPPILAMLIIPARGKITTRIGVNTLRAKLS
jgi:hypothetical protein